MNIEKCSHLYAFERYCFQSIKFYALEIYLGQSGWSCSRRGRDWEGQPWKGVFGLFHLLLLGCLLRVDESSGAGLEDSELLATDLSLLSGGELQGLVGALGVCKLHKAELVVSSFVGVLSAVSDSEVEDNAALVFYFEEFFEAGQVDGADGVDPDGPVDLFLVEVLYLFKKIN